MTISRDLFVLCMNSQIRSLADNDGPDAMTRVLSIPGIFIGFSIFSLFFQERFVKDPTKAHEVSQAFSDERRRKDVVRFICLY